jgi:hypothetical protein
MDEHEIAELVTRLSRPHSSGGIVIERAAILAAGTDFPTVIDWIESHAGTPETTVPPARGGGLHGSRFTGSDGATTKAPLRYVLPAGALRGS